MNNTKRNRKRMARINKKNLNEVDGVLVHAFMVYECENCGERWNMWIEKGLEEFGENHKPTPYTIQCKCGGLAKDISGLRKLPGYFPINNNMSYFANVEDIDCGKPILK